MTVAPHPAERQQPILQSAAERSLSGSVALQVVDLRKFYGDIEAVRGVSFEAHEGEVFGLLGPNGAGKTTMLSIIATLLRASDGDAQVFGHHVGRERQTVRHLIGVAPQDIAIYPNLTAAENLRFFGRMFGIRQRELTQRVRELLALVELDARADDPAGTFSGGMKRRLNLAISLIHRPRLLLLDEPTVGVDPHSREHIFEIVRGLRAAGTAILYTTHYMEEAEQLCDRIAILDEGKIIAMGRLSQLLAEAGCEEVIELHGLPATVDLASLQTAPGVCSIERRGTITRVFTQGAVYALPAVSALLTRHADGVTVQINPLSLQTLFLRLTGKELRD
ncbi:MAG TPA: ABC transporter ATP-binding protein [Candidatus Kryptonia bacterium]|nr:ABC transporter ATP-binding protein [Candidatus Kryptonia bacterium]